MHILLYKKRLRDTVYKLRCMFVCTDVYFSRSCEQQFPLGGRLIAFGGKKTSLFSTYFYSLDLYFSFIWAEEPGSGNPKF